MVWPRGAALHQTERDGARAASPGAPAPPRVYEKRTPTYRKMVGLGGGGCPAENSEHKRILMAAPPVHRAFFARATPRSISSLALSCRAVEEHAGDVSWSTVEDSGCCALDMVLWKSEGGMCG